MDFSFLQKFGLGRLSWFGSEDQYVALDIGSSSVKLVEAAKDRAGYRLMNVGIAPLPPTAVQNNMVVEKAPIASAIRSVVREHKITAKKVISVVPGRAAIIKKLQLPVQREEELDANVEFEAANVIPESLENVNLDYQVLNFLEEGTKMEILVVAVKKEIINGYALAIEEAGLMPVIMDVDYFAMENMYETNYEASDELVALVHVGARYTSINMLKGGISAFTGDLPLGGEAFTESLMEQLNIGYDQAESLKITGVLDGEKNLKVEELLDPLCHSLVEDISRTLTLYGTMAAGEPAHRVYLSGGGSKFKPLAPLLEKKLNVPVHLAEPFRAFTLARNVNRDAVADAALSLAVGAGLATRRPGDK
ncbi:MAG TPA: type IV pilus assembly protein PilM [Candidatus Acidoferrales bacterium]|nr:type IV pilus assembly protein PilM [Candidatus Acidoferrales bacterium]